MPNSALAEISDTVRHLNLSHNSIQHIDSTMLSSTLKLLSLSLAHNRLTILPDNIFLGLSSLLTLDLADNHIRANFKEQLHSNFYLGFHVYPPPHGPTHYTASII